MRIYIEFNGNKLIQTECFNYQDVQLVLHKILSQCILAYKKIHKKDVSQTEELQIQERILAKLKIIRTDSRWGNIKFRKLACI